MPVPEGQIGMGGLLVPTYKDASGNDGKLVRLRDIDDGEQLVDSVPTYATANVTHDATNHVLSLTISATNIPKIAEFYFFTPATLPRNDEPLSMDYNGQGSRRFALYHPDGSRATISDIHPSALYIALLHQESGGTTRRYTITEHLGPRPQDFVIHMFAFEATNAAFVPPDYNDPVHTLTQALIDGAMTGHTMSTATSPRVNYPDDLMPSRAFGSTGVDARDEYLHVFLYIAVPDVAPDVRGLGVGDNRGWGGSVSGSAGAFTRLTDKFNINGVLHKFVRRDASFDPDFSNDPPTGWEDFDARDPFIVVAFEGHPTPQL